VAHQSLTNAWRATRPRSTTLLTGYTPTPALLLPQVLKFIELKLLQALNVVEDQGLINILNDGQVRALLLLVLLLRRMRAAQLPPSCRPSMSCCQGGRAGQG